MRAIFTYIFICVLFLSCEEPFQLDLKQSPTKVVIEGLVTDRPEMQSIKVTRSTDFYGTGQTPRVTNAGVSVTDDLGSVVNFVHNPRNHPDSSGIYVPEVSFAGSIGRTYTLKVSFEGEVYEAEDELVSIIPIDSLTIEIDKEEQANPEEKGEFYEVLMFAREPQDVDNFYLFKFYKNDTLSYFFDTDIYYSDDELLAEKIDGVPAPVYYSLNDLARVEVFSLSRKGFLYYDDLWSLLNNDAGGMFGPIPSSPRTNLSNGALGFFQVSAVSSEEINVE